MTQPDGRSGLLAEPDSPAMDAESTPLTPPRQTQPAPRQQLTAAVARVGLRVAITAALLGALLTRVNIAQAAVALQHIALPLTVGAGALMVAVGACSAIRWRILLHALGVVTTLPTIVRLTALAIPWNLVIPGGESGTLVRAALLARQQPAAKGKIWASIVMEHLILVIAELSVGGIALLLARHPPPQLALWLATLVAIIAAMVGLALLFLLPFAPARRDLVIARISQALVMPASIRRGWGRVTGATTPPPTAGDPMHNGEWLAPLWQGLINYRGQVGALLQTLAVSLGYYAILYAAYWLAALGLGMSLGYMDIAWLVALAGVATHLPVTVAGVGVREGILIFFLTQRGVSPATALAFSIAILALNVGLSLPGLFLQAAQLLRWPTQIPDADAL